MKANRSCDMVEVGGLTMGFGVEERKGDGFVERFLLKQKRSLTSHKIKVVLMPPIALRPA